MEQELLKTQDFKGFGMQLKKLRESRGISLEQINKDTKIRIKYLEAIESGELSKIPGGEVYIKGFLSSYGEAIGLDSDQIIQQYKNIAQSEEKKEKEEKVEDVIDNERSETTDKKLHQININPKIIIYILIAILLIFCLSKGISYIKIKHENDINSMKQETNDVKTPHLDTKSDETSDDNLTRDDADEVIEKVSVELIEEDKNNSVYMVNDEIIKASLEVLKDRCWIRVKENEKTIYEATLDAGKEESWDCENNLKIRVGNPNVIKLIVNGQELELSGNNARNIILKRRD